MPKPCDKCIDCKKVISFKSKRKMKFSCQLGRDMINPCVFYKSKSIVVEASNFERSAL